MTHSVLVHLKLSDSELGTREDLDDFLELEEQLMAALGDGGDFDGNEFGGGKCIFFMYGEDADQVFAAVEQVLRASPLSAGGYAVKRYGDVFDDDAREVKVLL